MTRQPSVLAPILRSETQARLLASLLLRPHHEASIADLAREIGADPGNLHEEVQRLVQAGILADRRVGRSRLLRASDGPLVTALTNLLKIGYGPKFAVETALEDVAGIEQAFIAGSWAARYRGLNGEFPRDIDVVLVGTPNRDDASEAVYDAMREIGQEAQVVFRSVKSWQEERDAFTRTAKAGPLVELTIGGSS